MSEPQTVRWPWAVWAFMLCLVAAALTLSLANDTFDTFVAIAVPMMIGYGTIGAFVAARVRGNPLGWLMLTVGLSFGVVAVSSEYLVWAVRNDAPLQAVVRLALELGLRLHVLAAPHDPAALPDGTRALAPVADRAVRDRRIRRRPRDLRRGSGRVTSAPRCASRTRRAYRRWNPCRPCCRRSGCSASSYRRSRLSWRWSFDTARPRTPSAARSERSPTWRAWPSRSSFRRSSRAARRC